MKYFDSGDALAKEFGVAPAVLKKTFDDYNVSVRTQKDPFGKKVCEPGSISYSALTFCLSSSFLASGPTMTRSMSLS